MVRVLSRFFFFIIVIKSIFGKGDLFRLERMNLFPFFTVNFQRIDPETRPFSL